MKNKKIKIRELEDIIKNKRIYPVFQPIVDLRSGHIFAYEALSRVLGGSSMEIGELFELHAGAERSGNSRRYAAAML